MQCCLVEVEVVTRVGEAVFLQFFRRESQKHLIEHMVVSLPLCLAHNAGLLQQVLRSLRTTDHTTGGRGGGEGGRRRAAEGMLIIY